MERFVCNKKIKAPNANMADHSVDARDKLHESKGGQASMFCFYNTSPGKSCFVVGLIRIVSPTLPILGSWIPAEGSEIFHSRESIFFSVSTFASEGKTDEGKVFTIPEGTV